MIGTIRFRNPLKIRDQDDSVFEIVVIVYLKYWWNDEIYNYEGHPIS